MGSTQLGQKLSLIDRKHKVEEKTNVSGSTVRGC